MTALTNDRHTPRRDGDLISIPVKAATTIYAGAMVIADAGYAAPGKTAENLVFLGRAEEFADNSAGGAGDVSIRVRRPGVFRWENSAGAGAIAQAEVGSKAYMVDDQTVTKTAAGATAIGTILEVDDDGVWVG